MWRSANQPLKSKVICCVNAQDYSRNLSLLVSGGKLEGTNWSSYLYTSSLLCTPYCCCSVNYNNQLGLVGAGQIWKSTWDTLVSFLGFLASRMNLLTNTYQWKNGHLSSVLYLLLYREADMTCTLAQTVEKPLSQTLDLKKRRGFRLSLWTVWVLKAQTFPKEQPGETAWL